MVSENTRAFEESFEDKIQRKMYQKNIRDIAPTVASIIDAYNRRLSNGPTTPGRQGVAPEGRTFDAAVHRHAIVSTLPICFHIAQISRHVAL